MPPKIEIKGIQEGIKITLGEGEWTEVQKSLLTHVDQQGDFLRGAKLTLEVGNRIPQMAHLNDFQDVITNFQS